MRPSCKWWCKGDQSSSSSYDAVVPVPVIRDSRSQPLGKSNLIPSAILMLG